MAPRNQIPDAAGSRPSTEVDHVSHPKLPMEAKVFMKDQTAAPLLTREQVRLKLNERGYPLTASYFNKISLPSVNAGPPVAKWWGKRPLYRLDEALAWAESRCGSSPGKLVTPCLVELAGDVH